MLLKKETGRLLLQVMKQEVGEAFTEEAAAAWKQLFAYIHDILQERNQQELQPLNKDDRDFLRDGWHQVKRNKDFGAKFLLKYAQPHNLVMKENNKILIVDFIYISKLNLNCTRYTGFSALTHPSRPWFLSWPMFHLVLWCPIPISLLMEKW